MSEFVQTIGAALLLNDLNMAVICEDGKVARIEKDLPAATEKVQIKNID